MTSRDFRELHSLHFLDHNVHTSSEFLFIIQWMPNQFKTYQRSWNAGLGSMKGTMKGTFRGSPAQCFSKEKMRACEPQDSNIYSLGSGIPTFHIKHFFLTAEDSQNISRFFVVFFFISEIIVLKDCSSPQDTMIPSKMRWVFPWMDTGSDITDRCPLHWEERSGDLVYHRAHILSMGCRLHPPWHLQPPSCPVVLRPPPA